MNEQRRAAITAVGILQGLKRCFRNKWILAVLSALIAGISYMYIDGGDDAAPRERHVEIGVQFHDSPVSPSRDVPTPAGESEPAAVLVPPVPSSDKPPLSVITVTEGKIRAAEPNEVKEWLDADMWRKVQGEPPLPVEEEDEGEGEAEAEAG